MKDCLHNPLIRERAGTYRDSRRGRWWKIVAGFMKEIRVYGTPGRAEWTFWSEGITVIHVAGFFKTGLKWAQKCKSAIHRPRSAEHSGRNWQQDQDGDKDVQGSF